MSMTRLEKVGTIYSRLRSALEGGVLKKEFTPMWFPLYEAFPPRHEPRYDRKPDVTGPAPKVLYPEDTVRAAFYKQFGDRHEVIDLHDKNFVTMSTKFVRAFERVESENATFKQNFIAAVNDMEQNQGINLREMDLYAAMGKPREVESEGQFRARRLGGNRATPLATPSFEDLFALDEPPAKKD